MSVANTYISWNLLITGALVVLTHSVTTSPCNDVMRQISSPGVKYRPCKMTPDHVEVHIISVRLCKPGATRTIDLTLKVGATPRPVRLALLSRVRVNWTILASNLVYVDKVLIVASAPGTIKLPKGQEFHHQSHILPPDDLYDSTGKPNVTKLEQLVYSKLGALTSYEADFTNTKSSFGVELGYCDSSSDLAKSVLTNEEEACLKDAQCLLSRPFDYTGAWTDCQGGQYVSKYRDLYVGIVLCQPDRYKLLLSTSLEGRFLDIADRNPLLYEYGADHCELLGQLEAHSVVDPQRSCPDKQLGFYRLFTETEFRYGKICGRVHTSEYTAMYAPKWYECNSINIPGAFTIVRPQVREQEVKSSPTEGGHRPRGGVNSALIVAPCLIGILLIIIIATIIICKKRKRVLTNTTDAEFRPPAETPPIYDEVYAHRMWMLENKPNYPPPQPPNSVSDGLALVVGALGLPNEKFKEPHDDSENYTYIFPRPSKERKVY